MIPSAQSEPGAAGGPGTGRLQPTHGAYPESRPHESDIALMQAVLEDRFRPPAQPEAKWHAWCEQIEPFFDLSRRPETAIEAPVSMRNLHFGQLLVGDISAPAQDLLRPARKIARQDVDSLVLQFYTAGTSRVTAGRGESLVDATRFVVHDLSRETRITSGTRVDAVNVLLPRAALAERIADVDALHGLSLDHAGNAAATLFLDYLRGMIAGREGFGADQLPSLCEAAVRLCGAFLHAPGERPLDADLSRAIAIRSFIRRNLTSPELDVDMIARRFAVSRATLYRQFRDEGGIQAFIREKRLLRAMRALSEASGERRPRIAATAYACGFRDEKSFSQAFQRRFGCRPSEAREWATSRPAGEGAGDRMLAWLKDLSG